MASIECGTADLNLAVIENGVKVLTVNASAVTADSKVLLTYTSQSTGFLSVGTIVPGTSFQIVSTNANDTSSVNWLIVNNVGVAAAATPSSGAVASGAVAAGAVAAGAVAAGAVAATGITVDDLTKASFWSRLICKKRGLAAPVAAVAAAAVAVAAPVPVPAPTPVDISGALTVVRTVDVSGAAVTVESVVADVAPTVTPVASS